MPVWSTTYPTNVDSFADQVDAVDTVTANHVNTLATAVKQLQAKAGKDDSAVTTSFDYILRQARHTSKITGGATSTDIAYILDSLNAFTGSAKLVSFRNAGVEKASLEDNGDLILGVGGSGVLQLGTTDVNKRIIAEQAGAPDGEIRYNATTNVWELSNDGGAFSAIASPGTVSMQDTYGVNSSVTTTGSGGSSSWTRGAGTANGEGIFELIDANAQTGRTGILLSILDSNIVGAGTPDTFQVSRTATGGRAVRSQVVAGGEIAWSSGLTTPSSTATIFGDGDVVFGAADMSGAGTARMKIKSAGSDNLLWFEGAVSGGSASGFYNLVVSDTCSIYTHGALASDGGSTTPGGIVSLGWGFMIGANSDIGAGNKQAVYVSFANAAGLDHFQFMKSGDTRHRLRVKDVGDLEWGSGSGAGDATLGRDSAGVLKYSGTSLNISTGAALFSDGDAVFGATAMASTEKLRVVGSSRLEGNVFLGTNPTDQAQLQDGSYANPALIFASDTNLGLYRVGADSLGIDANTLTLRSPANDPATNWQNNAGTTVFSLGVAGGTYASFSSGDTFDGWRFNRNKTPADSSPVAEFIYNDASGSAGAGNPLLAAARSINGGVPSAHRVFQFDGDALMTLTGRITGTLGPVIKMQHLDGDVGVAGDVLARISGWGADDTTAATMLEYGRLNFRITDPTAATPIGELSLNMKYGSGIRHILTMRAIQTATDSGVLLENHKADDTNPSFDIVSTADIAAAHPLVRFSDTGGVLAQLDGDGDFYLPTIGSKVGIGIDPDDTVHLKSHTGYAASGALTRTSVAQTTDATVTTLATLTLATSTGYSVRAYVTARDTADTEQASYGKTAHVYRAGGGAAQQGTTQDIFTDIESTGTMDATIDVNGNDCRVRITGKASTTINWICRLEYEKVSGSA
jgi:hypothetical protein